MNTFLLLISLLLNGVAIFAIMILFVRQNRLAQIEVKQAETIQEMEDTISSYLLEMKEENDRFIERFKKVGETSGLSKNVTKEKNGESSMKLEKDFSHLLKNENSPRQYVDSAYRQNLIPGNVKPTNGIDDDSIIALIDYNTNEQEPSKSKTDVNEPAKSLDAGQEDTFQESLLTQVLHLQKQGFSEEEIAKKLKRGKTEIRLLIKFRQEP